MSKPILFVNEGDEFNLINGDLTYRIIGAAMEVLNGLGHGLLEKPYERALAIEFGIQEISYTQQPEYPVLYRGELVGTFIPDLVVDDKVIVDAKVVQRITDHERGQMLNYLRVTGLKTGLILNFSKPKLEWERIVL